MSNPKIRIAIAGLGTVGQGLIEIVQRNGELLTARTGHDFEIVAINARSKTKNREVDISSYEWMDDPIAMAKRDDIDVVVELIGGEDGVAKAFVEAALESGKHVVTANKALLAHYGNELATLAESKGKSLRYEAAVAGGIPIIKSLGEGFAGNAIKRISGIMNGTTNYMLTRMEGEKISYDAVFDAANQLGYLEADPSLDVGGIDAAHKLAILTALGFGQKLDFDNVNIEGIENVSLVDIERAAELGFRIKLVCSAEATPDGVYQSVAPALVPLDSPLGQCMGVLNMVVVEGDAIGKCVLQGPGAGRGATASAVIGDICDIARNLQMPVFGAAHDTLLTPKSDAIAKASPFYVRLQLDDQVGVLAQVAQAFAAESISIDELRQLDHEGDETPLILVTHATEPVKLHRALAAINKLDAVLSNPIAFRIEEN